MFVRMAHWNCKPECWDEAARLFESAAVPMMQEEPGFVHAMLLGPPGDNARIAFTVWTDETVYREFANSEAMREITKIFGHMYGDDALPSPVEYKVWARSGS